MVVFLLALAKIKFALQTEELLPAFIRRQFVIHTREVCPNQSIGQLRKLREDIWGAEHWDSVDSIREHKHKEEVSILLLWSNPKVFGHIDGDCMRLYSASTICHHAWAT